ncbi:MAG: superoxide dismutase [Leptolyngbya sp. SIO1E4]|nr:superoxide dismutase [Leptolyngbya sp. SIO1E4]
MPIKKFSWLVASILLVMSLLWASFPAYPSLATPASQSANAPSSTVPEPRLVAQAQLEDEFVLPPLPYAYDALNAYIDTQTMTLHHDKHHAGYVNNLNAAIAQHPELKGVSVEDLLRDLERVPEDIRTTVRKNGGGHANHTMFWEIMTPNGQREPTGAIATAIDDTFGDFETFQQAFNTAGKSQFGSGWAWLIMTQAGTLEVTHTANQDSPFLDGNYPIMGNDVWEHAYYLKYQNRRGEYLDAWWNVVDWEAVNNRFEAVMDALES